MTEETVHLFVYGTLREGERNEWLMTELGAEFLYQARTPAGFTLLDLHHFPGLIRGGKTRVTGDVYRVPTASLERLDSFEGHPNLFRREELITEREHIHADGAVGKGVFAYIYQRAEVIESGDWKQVPMRRIA